MILWMTELIVCNMGEYIVNCFVNKKPDVRKKISGFFV